MKAASSPIISHFGNRTIEWNPITLQALLAELRDERQRHDTEIENEAAELQHNRLLNQAEAIKREATNAISEVESRT